MNPALRFVLAGTQGGKTRLCVLEILDGRAQNSVQLSESVDVSRSKLDHHLDILQENDLIEKRSVARNAPYHLTRQTRADWDHLEVLLEQVEKPATPLLGRSAD